MKSARNQAKLICFCLVRIFLRATFSKEKNKPTPAGNPVWERFFFVAFPSATEAKEVSALTKTSGAEVGTTTATALFTFEVLTVRWLNELSPFKGAER